eukprot:7625-Heterococcus_DN1.PRE.2
MAQRASAYKAAKVRNELKIAPIEVEDVMDFTPEVALSAESTTSSFTEDRCYDSSTATTTTQVVWVYTCGVRSDRYLDVVVHGSTQSTPPVMAFPSYYMSFKSADA